MPYKSDEQRRMYERERGRRRRARGLCVSCPEPATVGHRCRACQDKHNARRRKPAVGASQLRCEMANDTTGGADARRKAIAYYDWEEEAVVIVLEGYDEDFWLWADEDRCRHDGIDDLVDVLMLNGGGIRETM